jgi:hypothetical protein
MRAGDDFGGSETPVLLEYFLIERQDSSFLYLSDACNMRHSWSVRDASDREKSPNPRQAACNFLGDVAGQLWR